MANVNEVLEGLNERTQRALFDKLALQFKSRRVRHDKQDEFSHDERSLWSALVIAANRPEPSSVGAAKALSHFCASYGRPRFRDALDEVDMFIDEACGARLSRPQMDFMRRLVLKSLAGEMAHWSTEDGRQFPIIPRTLLNNLDHMPPAVENDFPGYAAARLLHRILPRVAA